jgi:hypothetical protein
VVSSLTALAIACPMEMLIIHPPDFVVKAEQHKMIASLLMSTEKERSVRVQHKEMTLDVRIHVDSACAQNDDDSIHHLYFAHTILQEQRWCVVSIKSQ